MAFTAKTIRWYEETTVGVKPASPTNFKLSSATGYNITEDQASEDVVCVGADGEAGGKSYGTSSFAGDIPLVLTGDLIPILLHHAVGAPTTVVDATSDSWTATTAVAADDIVNHSDGQHTLFCFTAGTTSGTEPDLTTASEFDKVTDGTVVWIVRPLLKLRTGKRESCLSTFGLELNISEGCSGGSEEYERVGGCYLNTVEFGKAAGDISLKATAGVIATNRTSSMEDPAYPAQCGTDVELPKEYINNCDLAVYLDGALATNLTELKVPINRNITSEPTLVCDENIVSVGTIAAEGSINGLFSKEQYNKGANHDTAELKLVYSHKGDVHTLIFNIEFSKAPLTVEASKNVTLSGGFSIKGTTDNPSITYTSVTGVNY